MSEIRNILHISAQKPDSTGSGIYLHETVSAFADMGMNQAVIAGIAPEDEPIFPEGVLFEPVVFNTVHLPFPVVGMSDVMPYEATRYRDMDATMVGQFTTAFARALDSVLDRFTPDLVICHHLYLLCGIVAYRLAQRSQDEPDLDNCRVFGLSHSTDIRQLLQTPLERDFIRAGVHMLDGIFSLHAQQAEEIAEAYGVPSSFIHVVGTGYNKDRFKLLDGVRQAGTHNLVFVGKIGIKKGALSLVRALGAVQQSHPDAKLTLIGGYSNQEEYDKIVETARQADAPAVFAGRVSNEVLVRTYNESDVFVLPSFFEGLPLVVLEALACGCKVVVTDLPGIRPWIEANVPDAPIWFVEPPRMVNIDTPADEDLPAFEGRLATALVGALDAPQGTCDVTSASWDSLCKRIVSTAEE